MPTAILNGLNFHYERAGDGPPLLLDLRHRQRPAGPAQRLRLPAGEVLRPSAYDQRGLGRTDKPDAPYTMADYADDAAALMDNVGWDEALVIGVSFGGMVAQELVLRHPGKVKRLVLACTSPGGEGGASFAFHEIEHLKGEERARFLIPISDTRRDAAWAAAHPQDYAAFVAMAAAAPYADEPGHAAGAHRQLEKPAPATTPGTAFRRSPARCSSPPAATTASPSPPPRRSWPPASRAPG